MNITNQKSTGIHVRSSLQAGYIMYFTEQGETLSDAEICNNKCLRERDARTLDCTGKGWPQDGSLCSGNNNGKQLDLCMSFCWTPAEMKRERPLWGQPYYSAGGDKCFNEFVARSYDPAWTLDNNRAEWTRCMATVS